MNEFDWSKAGVNIHLDLDNLDDDNHYQYLNGERHGVFDKHVIGSIVPHNSHDMLENLDSDDHIHSINSARHNRGRHPTGVVPEFSMVVSGGPGSEPVFTMDGDIIVVEVM